MSGVLIQMVSQNKLLQVMLGSQLLQPVTRDYINEGKGKQWVRSNPLDK